MLNLELFFLLVTKPKTYMFGVVAFFLVCLKQAISVHGVAEVVDSDDSKFEKGDIVKGIVHWAQYSVVKAGESALMKLDTLEFPLTYHLGILGEILTQSYCFVVGNYLENFTK